MNKSKQFREIVASLAQREGITKKAAYSRISEDLGRSHHTVRIWQYVADGPKSIPEPILELCKLKYG